ncbi:beta-carotene 15, 15-dioxygenase 2, like isoform X2 [Alosa alosa]|uniref:beta-carotene 15, 15-dioxygenase 2, like isoform X2 n=1 Tax=Alosa alosa TaxID=278164 RepID=UPI00201541A4|nr:beta-carotene 15, 15-dioxygenase 2, like isoform X2 [Alosa alosa]
MIKPTLLQLRNNLMKRTWTSAWTRGVQYSSCDVRQLHMTRVQSSTGVRATAAAAQPAMPKPKPSAQPSISAPAQKTRPVVSGLECIKPLVSTVEETPELIGTTVKGTIPSWVHGSFLRNGPGKFEFGENRYTHWFDGMALMHRFYIKDGEVTYCSRFLRSDSYVKNSEKNRIVVTEFGTLAMPDPCKNIFARFFSRFQVPKATDNASVNFVKYKGDYYVSTETNYMRMIDPQSLETKDKVDWSKFVAVNAATAHPHYDRDGTTYNLGNSYGKGGFFYNIVRVPLPKEKVEKDEADLSGAEVLCSIPASDSRRPSYYHSFAMSENYVVFIEQPIKLDLLKFMLYRIQGKSFHKVMEWDPSLETIFHVVDKRTGKESKVTYYGNAMFTLHQINAYEDQGQLVMDMCCGDDGAVIGDFTLENLSKASGEELDKFYNGLCTNLPRRYVLPLDVNDQTPVNENMVTLPFCTAKAVKMADGRIYCVHENLYGDDLLAFGGLEFPQINYNNYNTRKYRYYYSCGFGHVFSDSLLKMDVETKELKSWRYPGLYPSEPVFVPSPEATDEDDGVVMSVIITPREEKSTFLLVLDAKTFTELGRAEVPVNIPYGTHGVFNDRA